MEVKHGVWMVRGSAVEITPWRTSFLDRGIYDGGSVAECSWGRGRGFIRATLLNTLSAPFLSSFFTTGFSIRRRVGGGDFRAGRREIISLEQFIRIVFFQNSCTV